MLDANHDGTVTFAEFVDRVREAELSRRQVEVVGMHRRDVGEHLSQEEQVRLE